MSKQETISLEDVAASFSVDLPEWQKAVNLNWLRGIHAVLREGGTWGSPNLGTVYTKQGDGFVAVIGE